METLFWLLLLNQETKINMKLFGIITGGLFQKSEEELVITRNSDFIMKDYVSEFRSNCWIFAETFNLETKN